MIIQLYASDHGWFNHGSLLSAGIEDFRDKDQPIMLIFTYYAML